MKTVRVFSLSAAVMLCLIGCATPHADPRVNTLEVPGIDIQHIVMRRTPEGFMEMQATGYNQTREVRRFDYRVEWLDADGMVIPSKTRVWQPASAQPRSEFRLHSIAPQPTAVDFRINTRPMQ